MSFLLAICLSARLVTGAPVKVEVHYMPPGQKVYLPEAKAWGRGFDLGEYKLLLKMDQDLWDANKTIRIYKDLDLKYRKVIEQKDNIINTLLDDRKIIDERLKRVEENWHKAEQLAIDNAGGPIWPYIVGAAGAVVGVVGVTLYASERLR